MKKILTSISLASVLILSGCGNKDSDSDSKKKSSDSDPKTSVEAQKNFFKDFSTSPDIQSLQLMSGKSFEIQGLKEELQNQGIEIRSFKTNLMVEVKDIEIPEQNTGEIGLEMPDGKLNLILNQNCDVEMSEDEKSQVWCSASISNSDYLEEILEIMNEQIGEIPMVNVEISMDDLEFEMIHDYQTGLGYAYSPLLSTVMDGVFDYQMNDFIEYDIQKLLETTPLEMPDVKSPERSFDISEELNNSGSEKLNKYLEEKTIEDLFMEYSRVSEEGGGEINGEKTTKYTFTPKIADFIEDFAEADESEEAKIFSENLDLTASFWMNENNEVLKFKMDLNLGSLVSQSLYGNAEDYDQGEVVLTFEFEIDESISVEMPENVTTLTKVMAELEENPMAQMLLGGMFNSGPIDPAETEIPPINPTEIEETPEGI